MRDTAYDAIALVPDAQPASPVAPLVVLPPEEPEATAPPRRSHLMAFAFLGVAFLTVIIAVVLVATRS